MALIFHNHSKYYFFINCHCKLYSKIFDTLVLSETFGVPAGCTVLRMKTSNMAQRLLNISNRCTSNNIK